MWGVAGVHSVVSELSMVLCKVSDVSVVDSEAVVPEV